MQYFSLNLSGNGIHLRNQVGNLIGGVLLKSQAESGYRLELAVGFYAEAKQDFELSRWRSCVDNSQHAVENSGKTVIACFQPVEKSHNSAKQVIDLIKNEEISPDLIDDIKVMIPMLRKLGFEEHLRTGYGDEIMHKSPWELFNKDDASQALEMARKCSIIARKVYEYYFG